MRLHFIIQIFNSMKELKFVYLDNETLILF
jgi:hypothetical protein